MSWFSNNYEKTTLAGVIIIALAFIYLGWSKYSGTEEDLGPVPSPPRAGASGAVPSADLIPKAQQSLKLDHVWTRASEGTRPVDLFTGIALFIHKNNPQTPLDPINDSAIHPPIENKWWLENRIDPGFGDSPERDPDSDGFSNLEEYKGKTDPNDNKSFPSLIDKLKYVKDETLTWVVRPGYSDGQSFPYSYEDSKGQRNNIPAGESVSPEKLFFIKGAQINRFKHLGKETRKETNTRTNSEEEVTYARFEDQKSNKLGKIYMVPEGLPDIRKQQFIQFDRTAVFSLEALGQSGVEFKVEENTQFALPPDSPNKTFLLKKVTPGSVTLEYSDPQGNKKTLDINKGSMPQPT